MGLCGGHSADRRDISVFPTLAQGQYRDRCRILRTQIRWQECRVPARPSSLPLRHRAEPHHHWLCHLLDDHHHHHHDRHQCVVGHWRVHVRGPDLRHLLRLLWCRGHGLRAVFHCHGQHVNPGVCGCHEDRRHGACAGHDLCQRGLRQEHTVDLPRLQEFRPESGQAPHLCVCPVVGRCQQLQYAAHECL